VLRILSSPRLFAMPGDLPRALPEAGISNLANSSGPASAEEGR
jgi:hypothetical protein